jgi:hypothetical protein
VIERQCESWEDVVGERELHPNLSTGYHANQLYALIDALFRGPA